MWNVNVDLFSDIYVLLWMYLVVINLVTFLFFGIDKGRARKGKWRISEKTLLLLAVIGGSVGAFLGMRVFHHKTQKTLFRIAVPVIFILQVVCFVVVR